MLNITTIKAMAKDMDDTMYAVIVLSESLFGFGVPEKDRTKIIEVNTV